MAMAEHPSDREQVLQHAHPVQEIPPGIGHGASSSTSRAQVQQISVEHSASAMRNSHPSRISFATAQWKASQIARLATFLNPA